MLVLVLLSVFVHFSAFVFGIDGSHFGLPPHEVGIRTLDELGKIFTDSGPGIGVVLGLGPHARFPLRFLHQWKNGVLYLCDPFIHIVLGYDDLPEYNTDDRTHQLNFEKIRNALLEDKGIQGRYSMVREFSFSFARLWKEKNPRYEFGDIPPRFVYIDNNPATEAVLRDMRDWWPMLLDSGVLAGSRAELPSVQKAVEIFSKEVGEKALLFLSEAESDEPESRPGWIIMKPTAEELAERAERRKRKEGGTPQEAEDNSVRSEDAIVRTREAEDNSVRSEDARRQIYEEEEGEL